MVQDYRNSTGVHRYMACTWVQECRVAQRYTGARVVHGYICSRGEQKYRNGTGLIQRCRSSTAVHVNNSIIVVHGCRISTDVPGCKSDKGVHKCMYNLYRCSTWVPE
jgi:hypothetical protein